MEEKYKNCPIVGCRVECGSVPCKSLRKTFGVDDEPQKRKTNADRIRAMSDEELAKILVDGFCCNSCKYKDTNRWDCPEECEKCCAEWLKQPAEDGA